MPQRKRILVTGGAGFIGFHLCSKLLSQGHKVICLDNFYTSSRDNIKPLIDHPNFELVEQSVEYPFHFDVDQIYNLACPASPIHYQKDPVMTFKTSVWGAYYSLELALKCGAKIMQASTSEVYGDPECRPQNEGYWGHVNPIGIRSCYDEGKRGAETLFMDYHRKYGTHIKIIRIFNTYGPNMQPNDGRVVSNFIIQALKGQDITIYGDGTQTRSFQYVDNLIEGMIKIMDTPDSFIGPVNLGNPSEITVAELAQKIIDLTGTKSKIKFEPLPMDDPKERQPDITVAKAVIGYNPDIQLTEGLNSTIEYFIKKLSQAQL